MASSGKFLVGAKYESNDGGIYPIRVQNETTAANVGAVNAQPAAAIDQEISARVGGSKRGYGMKARTVTLRWTGAAPDGYAPNSVVTIPVLTPAVWNAIKKGQTATYQGADAVVVFKSAEHPG